MLFIINNFSRTITAIHQAELTTLVRSFPWLLTENLIGVFSFLPPTTKGNLMDRRANALLVAFTENIVKVRFSKVEMLKDISVHFFGSDFGPFRRRSGSAC
jgi:hypothetical protein